jgi:hypothetical protein
MMLWYVLAAAAGAATGWALADRAARHSLGGAPLNERLLVIGLCTIGAVVALALISTAVSLW